MLAICPGHTARKCWSWDCISGSLSQEQSTQHNHLKFFFLFKPLQTLISHIGAFKVCPGPGLGFDNTSHFVQEMGDQDSDQGLYLFLKPQSGAICTSKSTNECCATVSKET
jgi:hypothetical protein